MRFLVSALLATLLASATARAQDSESGGVPPTATTSSLYTMRSDEACQECTQYVRLGIKCREESGTPYHCKFWCETENYNEIIICQNCKIVEWASELSSVADNLGYAKDNLARWMTYAGCDAPPAGALELTAPASLLTGSGTSTASPPPVITVVEVQPTTSSASASPLTTASASPSTTASASPSTPSSASPSTTSSASPATSSASPSTTPEPSSGAQLVGPTVALLAVVAALAMAL